MASMPKANLEQITAQGNEMKLRTCYKIALISALFVVGLIIAGIIYPGLDVLCKPASAKHQRGCLNWLG